MYCRYAVITEKTACDIILWYSKHEELLSLMSLCLRLSLISLGPWGHMLKKMLSKAGGSEKDKKVCRLPIEGGFILTFRNGKTKVFQEILSLAFDRF